MPSATRRKNVCCPSYPFETGVAEMSAARRDRSKQASQKCPLPVVAVRSRRRKKGRCLLQLCKVSATNTSWRKLPRSGTGVEKTTMRPEPLAIRDKNKSEPRGSLNKNENNIENMPFRKVSADSNSGNCRGPRLYLCCRYPLSRVPESILPRRRRLAYRCRIYK